MNDFLILLLEFKVKCRSIVRLKLFFGSKLKFKKKYRLYFFIFKVKFK